MAIRWEKLTVKSQEAMQQAQGRAAELGNPEIQPVHLLLALIEDREGVIPAVLEKIGVPTERLESNLHQIEEKLPRVAGASAQPGLEPCTHEGVVTRRLARPRTSKMNTFQPNICFWAWRTRRAMRPGMHCLLLAQRMKPFCRR